MLIGIDASRAVKKFKTGTEYYSEQIIYHLSLIDKTNDYILYAPNMPTDEVLLKLPKNFTWKIMPFPRFWSQIRLSWELKFGKPKPDVVFEPAHTIPIWHHKKTVATLHDLGFKYYPELYTPFERVYHNWCMDFSANRAKQIITPSEYTKKDLIKIYRLNPEKITVIYHGYNKKLYNDKKSDLPTSELRHLSSEPYIFFIGRIEEKKNIKGMIEAFRILRKNNQIKHKLILAGKPGYNYDDIKTQINNLPENIKKDVIELGYVPEKDVAGLIKNADIFFFPSFFEGFGLPIIEAMACGVPVVASDATSISEIAKDCALLISPEKPSEMAKALEKIILDRKLHSLYTKKGLERAKEFLWEKAAQETLSVLEKIAKD